MKKSYLLTLTTLLAFNLHSFSQTTLTEDVDGVLNTNRIVAQTAGGQVFFTGRQFGSGYAMPYGIFRAITDNTGGSNYFYDGVSGSTTTFSVRSDGQGYFAGNIGIGTTTPKSALHVMGSFITGGNNANLDPAIPANIPNSLANTGQMLIGWNRAAGPGETDFIANQGGGAPVALPFIIMTIVTMRPN